ncbi:hypothetical protein BDF20DRAFT_526227 [Mycotypha africana]|uniref:uncharacterized protein n=1 Tax=Mycotypha africana TaxID=64632 RepID=UPI0022FFCC19|nr:uncharacterized protein BDF20DRAFT_526227 [Mycotypha africana]KAI8979694.1 hypothetical protein BDF20DRAFT_526227 [Mycotypha africana]
MFINKKGLPLLLLWIGTMLNKQTSLYYITFWACKSFSSSSLILSYSLLKFFSYPVLFIFLSVFLLTI